MAVSADTPIPTPTGWIFASLLTVGQLVFDRFGHATKVTAIQNYTPKKMYEVLFDDHAYLQGDEHLKLDIVPEFVRINRAQTKTQQKHKQKLRLTPVSHLLTLNLKIRNNTRYGYSTEVIDPVNFYSEDHPVPPFIVGLWSAYRNKYDTFTIPPQFLDYVKRKIKECNWTPVHRKGNIITIRPSIRPAFLTKYATIPTTIPMDYYFGSIEQRLELLRGMICRKPRCYNEKTGKFNIKCPDAKALARLQGLCESLGIKTLATEKTSGEKYLVFHTNHQIHHNQVIKKTSRKRKYRYIKEIVEIKPKPCVHIETEKPFAVGQVYTTTWQ